MRLLSEEVPPPAISSKKLRELVSPLLPEGVDWPMVSVKVPWIVIRSGLLKEEILLVCQKGQVEAAQCAHPDLTTYALPEMKILQDYPPGTIQRLHQLKRMLDGWIVRSTDEGE